MGLHSVGYVDIDGLRLWVATAGDEQRVGSRLTQVTGDKAVLPSGVTKRRRAGVSGGLTDVGDDGDTVHSLFVVTDLQNLKVNLDVGVPHAGSYTHPHSDLRGHPYAADVLVSSLAFGCLVVCSGFVTN